MFKLYFVFILLLRKLLNKIIFVGVIYYDMNEQNLLVKEGTNEEWEIAGVIDFQDASHGCKIYDIAIYISYMMMISKDPLETGGHCLQGFMKMRNVSEQELDVLYYCVAARLVISLLVGLHCYVMVPDKYYLDTQKTGWLVLKNLWKLNAEDVLKSWLS